MNDTFFKSLALAYLLKVVPMSFLGALICSFVVVAFPSHEGGLSPSCEIDRRFRLPESFPAEADSRNRILCRVVQNDIAAFHRMQWSTEWDWGPVRDPLFMRPAFTMFIMLFASASTDATAVAPPLQFLYATNNMVTWRRSMALAGGSLNVEPTNTHGHSLIISLEVF